VFVCLRLLICGVLRARKVWCCTCLNLRVCMRWTRRRGVARLFLPNDCKYDGANIQQLRRRLNRLDSQSLTIFLHCSFSLCRRCRTHLLVVKLHADHLWDLSEETDRRPHPPQEPRAAALNRCERQKRDGKHCPRCLDLRSTAAASC